MGTTNQMVRSKKTLSFMRELSLRIDSKYNSYEINSAALSRIRHEVYGSKRGVSFMNTYNEYHGYDNNDE